MKNTITIILITLSFSLNAEYIMKAQNVNINEYVKEVSEDPNASCKGILNAGNSTGSGVYTLIIDSQNIQAYCDMNTNGGGWTRVAYLPVGGASLGGYANPLTTVNHDTAGWSEAANKVKGTEIMVCGQIGDLTYYNNGSSTTINDAFASNIVKWTDTAPVNIPYINAMDSEDASGESSRLTVYTDNHYTDYMYYRGTTWLRNDENTFEYHNQTTDYLNCWNQHVWVR